MDEVVGGADPAEGICDGTVLLVDILGAHGGLTVKEVIDGGVAFVS
jgi:hypothetical protein